MKKLRVQVTAYKDHIIIETLDPKEKKDVFYPINAGRIGCVLLDTAKHLGISRQGLELLKLLERVQDDIGDVDSFESAVKGHVFGWIGDPNCTKTLDMVGSRSYNPEAIPHTVIPNKVPAWAKKQIDSEV